MKITVIVSLALFIVGCGGEDLPKTFAVYKDKQVLSVKKLSQSDKAMLYSDIFNQHKTELNGTTDKKLGVCLEDMMGNNSSFATFSATVENCIRRYQTNPQAF